LTSSAIAMDNSRIEDLRRRVQKDPASIAFAQLAEECRRAGEYQEAVETCRAGLEIHPGYLSARVTLGRSLVELGQLDEAKSELSRVLDSAPDNLAAIRGLAEIHFRRGEIHEALAQYRKALVLAPNDPDLEETVTDLSKQVEPAAAERSGLTMANMQEELQRQAPALATIAPAGPVHEPVPVPQIEETADASADAADAQVGDMLTSAVDDRAIRMVAALEQWLDAIHVTRADRHA
jgi:tetratricopeptide (TPR) repeat protein